MAIVAENIDGIIGYCNMSFLHACRMLTYLSTPKGSLQYICLKWGLEDNFDLNLLVGKCLLVTAWF